MVSKNLKRDQSLYNPCLKEYDLTNKCFHQNNFDYEKCDLPIQNYKVCKDFWHAVKKDRKRNGIKPYLPPLEEREQIKREYLKKQEIH